MQQFIRFDAGILVDRNNTPDKTHNRNLEMGLSVFSFLLQTPFQVPTHYNNNFFSRILRCLSRWRYILFPTNACVWDFRNERRSNARLHWCITCRRWWTRRALIISLRSENRHSCVWNISGQPADFQLRRRCVASSSSIFMNVRLENDKHQRAPSNSASTCRKLTVVTSLIFNVLRVKWPPFYRPAEFFILQV